MPFNVSEIAMTVRLKERKMDLWMAWTASYYFRWACHQVTPQMGIFQSSSICHAILKHIIQKVKWSHFLSLCNFRLKIQERKCRKEMDYVGLKLALQVNWPGQRNARKAWPRLRRAIRVAWNWWKRSGFRCWINTLRWFGEGFLRAIVASWSLS